MSTIQQLPTNTTTNDKRAHIKRIAALAQDKQYVHREALRLASAYLQGATQSLIESEIALLDDEIREDRELYEAYEALIETIAREAVQIGRDLAKIGTTEQRRSG